MVGLLQQLANGYTEFRRFHAEREDHADQVDKYVIQSLDKLNKRQDAMNRSQEDVHSLIKDISRRLDQSSPLEKQQYVPATRSLSQPTNVYLPVAISPIRI